jgi:hypothetical protein
MFLKKTFFAGLIPVFFIGLLFVACPGPDDPTVTDYFDTNEPIIEGLIGEWEEEYSTFTITSTTFNTGSEWGGYGGTIINHRGDGANAGYITIQYTSNDYAPDAIGAYYVIHYENLTATTMDISGAYDADDSAENGFTGKATQKEAERAYTTANGCFDIHTTVTRKVINLVTGPVYYPGEQPFEELMNLLEGYWSSSYDSYLVRKWSNFNEDDETLVAKIWDEYGVYNEEEEEEIYVSRYPDDWNDIDFNDLKTYESKKTPGNNDYVYAYLDDMGRMMDVTMGGYEDYYMAYFGLVRAVYISDDGWHAVIIEYFEEGDPGWISIREGITPRGTKPYFGLFIKVEDNNTVAMMNTTFVEDNYSPTEQATLEEAIALFNPENRLTLMADGVGVSQNRQ